MKPGEPIQVVLWTDAQRAGRDGHVIDRMAPHVRVVGVGGPRTAEIDALARRLDCPHEDDYRKLLVQHSSATILIGSGAETSATDTAQAVGGGADVVALDAHADAIVDLVRLHEVQQLDGAGRRLALPSFLRCRGWASAADPLQVIGPPQTVAMTSFAHPADGSLISRLMDAWTAVLSLVDLPESVDASLTGPLGTSVPQSLFGLTGHLLCHARLPGGGAVLMQASDQAAAHHRQMHVIGKDGRLEVSDHAYRLLSADGKIADQAAEDRGRTDVIDLITDDWRRLLRQAQSLTPRDAESELSAMACCLACQLSARTGEAESPAKLKAMQQV